MEVTGQVLWPLCLCVQQAFGVVVLFRFFVVCVDLSSREWYTAVFLFRVVAGWCECNLRDVSFEYVSYRCALCTGTARQLPEVCVLSIPSVDSSLH